MSELKGAAVIGQSGGPTSVINASAYGVIRTALDNPDITAVYGDVDFTYFAAPIDPTPEYSYFKYECLSTAANLMQVSEIVFCSGGNGAAAAPAVPDGYPASGESGNIMIGTVIGNETTLWTKKTLQ